MVLVIGATGFVGSDVVRRLCASGKPVRALVRGGGDAGKRAQLEAAGARLVIGDLKEPASLDRACEGVSTVVSTASATVSRGAGDNIDSVDRQGQFNLLDAARRAGTGHFIYVSFSGNVTGDFPLHTAKREVEARLSASGIAYTIVRPSMFMEVWLTPYVGFDPVAGRVRIYGSGDRPISFISAADVAAYVAGCVDNPAVRNAIIELGGPDAVTANQVVAMFEQALKRPIARDHVPEAALEQQFRAASDPMEKTLAGLALAVARGDSIDVGPALAKVPIALTPVSAFVASNAQTNP